MAYGPYPNHSWMLQYFNGQFLGSTFIWRLVTETGQVQIHLYEVWKNSPEQLNARLSDLLCSEPVFPNLVAATYP